MILITVLHIAYLYVAIKNEPHDLKDFIYILGEDLLFILVLFGIITSQDLLKGANIIKGNKDEQNP